MTLEDVAPATGIVVEAEVGGGTGVIAGEPVTRAVVRDDGGFEHDVRIVGGPTARGGRARLAGHVVPVRGERVRLDLREPRRTAPPATGAGWMPGVPAAMWAPEALPLTFVPALPRSLDLVRDLAIELELAARAWGQVPCTAFRARAGAEAAASPGDDGVNGVFVHDATWPDELLEGAVGQTVLHVDASGRLSDADIHLNAVAYRFGKGGQDARGVLVHEIGHALGLGHATDPRATMSVSGSGLRWRSLEADDIAGVCALYPGVGSGGCDVDACPEGLTCVAGACQRPGDPADVCAPCTLTAGSCAAAGDGARCVAYADAGLACGRGCTADQDCGTGFTCAPTSEAGDRQCVSLDACAAGAHPCRDDASCVEPGAVCRGGACLGPLPAPVRPDASGPLPNATEPASIASAGGSGCDCRAGPPVGAGGSLLVGALAILALRARRRVR